MDGADTRPAKGGSGDRAHDRPLRAGDPAERPRSPGGPALDVPHHLLDAQPVRVGLVADFQDCAARLDAVAVDVAPEELAAVEAPGDCLWDAGRKEFPFPENWLLPA